MKRKRMSEVSAIPARFPQGWTPRFFATGLLLLVLGLAANPASGQQSVEHERAVWQLWTTHTNNLARPETVLAECREYETRLPDSPFLDVCRGIAAWHLLKTGRLAEARRSFESMPFGGAPAPLAEAAREMARAWITRLDRERVVLALKRFYNREVAFPESLEALQTLPPEHRPPLTDAWGNPWRYRLRSFRFLEGIDNQRYFLESRSLGPDSELESAVGAPYAGALNYRPVRLISSAGRVASVAFTPPPVPGSEARPAAQTVASVGAMLELARFAHLGDRLIILADAKHWKLTPKP